MQRLAEHVAVRKGAANREPHVASRREGARYAMHLVLARLAKDGAEDRDDATIVEENNEEERAIPEEEEQREERQALERPRQ